MISAHELEVNEPTTTTQPAHSTEVLNAEIGKVDIAMMKVRLGKSDCDDNTLMWDTSDREACVDLDPKPITDLAGDDDGVPATTDVPDGFEGGESDDDDNDSLRSSASSFVAVDLGTPKRAAVGDTHVSRNVSCQDNRTEMNSPVENGDCADKSYIYDECDYPTSPRTPLMDSCEEDDEDEEEFALLPQSPNSPTISSREDLQRDRRLRNGQPGPIWDRLSRMGTACDFIFNCRYTMNQVEDEVREEHNKCDARRQTSGVHQNFAPKERTADHQWQNMNPSMEMRLYRQFLDD